MINKKFNDIRSYWNIKQLNVLQYKELKLILHEINDYLEPLDARDRIIWAKKYLPKSAILSSSFGIQSAVSLHLMMNYYPNIIIVLIDTGYLFPETYWFIDRLTKQMKLNLHVFCSNISAAWQEVRYGKLWEKGIKGIEKYNFINKVEPMNRALKKLKVGTWFAGLRRYQSFSRGKLPILAIQNEVFKFLPIVDWNDHQIRQYIQRYSLEHHPLWNQGYLSVGDIHTSSKCLPGMKEEDTRFFGLKRECGLHVVD